jgi:hypothetical protein
MTPLTKTRTRIVLACCLAVLAVLAGCAGAPGPAAPPPPAPPADHVDHASPVAPLAASAPGTDSGASSSLDAALQLESLLGQHAVLAADMMRGRIRNDEDFGQAANAAIGRNTDDLAQLVGALFGAPAADQFRTLWADHVSALFSYSRGLATDDAATRDQARSDLVRFENGIAEFFSTASQGRLPREAARSTVLTHVEHLVEQADAYAAKDYPRANALYREGYSHTFQLGHALATTLLPPEQAAALAEPQWRLRSELGRLLGEHVALAVGTLRAGATDSPDFPAAAAALNANTSDLTGAVGSLFGEPAGTQFMTLWADHVDQLVAYTAGVAGGDSNRQEQALANLRGFEDRLSAFLAAATDSRLPAAVLAKALLAHDDMLLRQVDAFVAKDYRQAQDIAYHTYQDMFGLARQLSDAFGQTVAARLPEGGAQTGAGGLVRTPGTR